MFRLIERYGVTGQHSWRITEYPTLDAARKMAAACVVDFLIGDACGTIEYRIG